MKKLIIAATLMLSIVTFAQAPVPPGLSTRDTQTIVYPNPNNGEMKIELRDKSINDLNIKMYDMNGKLINTTSIHKSNLEYFDFECEVKADVYIIQIITNNEVENRKIIIKH